MTKCESDCAWRVLYHYINISRDLLPLLISSKRRKKSRFLYESPIQVFILFCFQYFWLKRQHHQYIVCKKISLLLRFMTYSLVIEGQCTLNKRVPFLPFWVWKFKSVHIFTMPIKTFKRHFRIVKHIQGIKIFWTWISTKIMANVTPSVTNVPINIYLILWLSILNSSHAASKFGSITWTSKPLTLFVWAV